MIFDSEFSVDTKLVSILAVPKYGDTSVRNKMVDCMYPDSSGNRILLIASLMDIISQVILGDRVWYVIKSILIPDLGAIVVWENQCKSKYVDDSRANFEKKST